MAYAEFTGELDAPEVGAFVPFSGTLDQLPQDEVDTSDPLLRVTPSVGSSNPTLTVSPTMEPGQRSVLDGQPPQPGAFDMRKASAARIALDDPRTTAPRATQGERQKPDSMERSGQGYADSSLPVRAVQKARAGAAEGGFGVLRAGAEMAGADSVARVAAEAAGAAKGFQQGMGQNKPIAGFGPGSPVPYLADMAEGAGSSLLTSAAMASMFGAKAVIPLMSIQSAGQQYDSARRAGQEPWMALANAVPFGVFEAVGEKFQGMDKAAAAMGVLMRGEASMAAKKSAADALMRAGVREIPGEVITYGGQTVVDLLPGIGINQNLTMSQFLDGLRDTVIQAGMMGSVTAGTGAAARPAALPGAEAQARAKGFLEPTQAAETVMAAPDVDSAIAAATAAAQAPVAPAASPQAEQAVDNIAAILGNTTTQPEPQPAPADAPELAAPMAEPIAPPIEPAAPITEQPAEPLAALPPTQPAAGQPAATWFGRRGDGYQSQADAQAALPSRQTARPDLTWKIEPTEQGRFRLAGYAQPAPVTTASGFTVTLNPSGTASIRGDAGAIRSTLANFGIDKIITSPSGVTVGVSQAQQAVQALTQGATNVSDPVAPVGAVQAGVDGRSIEPGGSEPAGGLGDRGRGSAAEPGAGSEAAVPVVSEGGQPGAVEGEFRLAGYALDGQNAAYGQDGRLDNSAAGTSGSVAGTAATGGVSRAGDAAGLRPAVRVDAVSDAVRPDAGELAGDRAPVLAPAAEQPAQVTQTPPLSGVSSAPEKAPQSAPESEPSAPESATSGTAAPTERERIAAMVQASNQRKDKASPNPFKTFLIRNGIALRLAKEFAPGTKERLAMGRTFRNGGLELDALAERAAEMGYIRDRMDTDELYALIAKVASGERVAPMYGQDAEAEMERMVRERQEMDRPLDDFTPDEQEESGYAEADPQVQARVRALVAQMEAAGRDAESVLEDVAKKTENATAQDYYAAAEQALTAALAREGSAGAQDRGQTGGAEGAAARAEEEGLTAPTPADVLAQQEQRQAEQQRRDEGGDRPAPVKSPTRDQIDLLNPQGGIFDAPQFSLRDQQEDASIPYEEVEQIVDEMTAKWQNRPDIRVLDSMSEAPPVVLKQYLAQRSQGTHSRVHGFHLRGTVYIVADEMTSRENVQEVLFHEALGHYGMRELFGDMLKPMLADVLLGQRAQVIAKAKAYGLNMNKQADRLMAAEEVLAELAQSRPELGVIRRLVAAIRTWLRDNIPSFAKMKMTDDELIRKFILPARGFVERGQSPRPTFTIMGDEGPETVFSIGGKNEPMASRKDVVGNNEGGRSADDDTEGAAVRSARVRLVEEDYRLPNLANAIPKEYIPKEASQSTVKIYRAVPSDTKDATIRPGDWVSLSSKYAAIHGTGKTGRSKVISMDVPADHVAWAGTDMNEYFYVPREPNESPAPDSDGAAFSLGDNPSVTDSAAFRKWFGKSRVVDSEGKPLVVYHGTAGDFDTFDASRRGRATLHATAQLGEFFTAAPRIANEFVPLVPDYDTPPYTRLRQKTGGNVMPVYLSIQNPYTGMHLDEFRSLVHRNNPQESKDLHAELIADGYDGIYLRGDPSLEDTMAGDEWSADTWISFKPNQIKSAIGNNGNFDPEDNRVQFSLRSAVTNTPPLQTTSSQSLSPWRDASGRLQFAPGAWLFDKFGAEVGGAIVGGAIGSVAGPAGVAVGAAAGVVASRNLSLLRFKPAGKALTRQLREMKLAVQQAQETAAAVAGEAMKLTQDERDMVSDLIEQELAAGTVPPAHAVRLAAMINQSMESQTDELVRLGMLTKDSADMWRGKYLPRYYRNKLTKQVGDAWADAVAGLRRRQKAMAGIKGKHLKGRGLYETVPLDQIADWEALGWEVRDPDYQEYLKDPSQYVGPWEADVQMWRDFTRQERDNMGEIRDAGFRFVMGYMETQRDIALGRMFEGLAANPEMSAKRQSEQFSVHVPDGTVPGTGAKRYGKLAGRWVSVDTMSHLSQIEESQSEAWRMYRKAMALWKEGKTALNPVSHVNNVVSNVTMAHFAGVSYHRGDKYIAAARDFATKAPSILEAKEAGLFLGTMSDAELMNTLPEDLKILVRQQDSAATKIGRTGFNLMTFFLRRPMGWAYQAEDTFFRYLIWKDARDRGMDPKDAVDYAQKFIFTYDDLPKGARLVRDFGIPFFAYTYKATPALLETALTHPMRFAAPAAVLWAINAAAYAIAAGDDDDDWDNKLKKYLTDPEYRAAARQKEQLEREHLPPWNKGTTALLSPKMIRLGTDELTKLPLFIDVARIIPGGDLFDVSPNAGGIPLPQPVTPSHPLFTTAVAMLGNKDLFRGKDLVDSNDTTGEAAEKRAEWLWKQITPAIAAGNHHFERGMNALAQASGGEVKWLPEAVSERYTGVGRDGLPVQGKWAAAQTFGIKIRPLDLDKAEQIDASQRKRMLREIEAEMRSLRRLNNLGAVSDRAYDKAREMADIKKERLREGRTVDGKDKD